KHPLFFSARSSILITAAYGDTAAHWASLPPHPKNRRYKEGNSLAAALRQSFLLAMSGHAGPIQMDLGVTPFVQRISLGQAVALLKGRRARRADLTGGSLSNRAGDGDCGQPKSCDGRCQPKLCRGLGEQPRDFVSLWFR